MRAKAGVTATLLGSQRVYRWAHRNALLEMRSPRYTHDILVHAAMHRPASTLPLRSI